MAKKNSLGRTLDALLVGAREPVNAGSQKPEQNTHLLELPTYSLQPGRYQPRREFDSGELESLADSIRSQGILQPLLVRHITPGSYEIIAGERRWRAAQLAGLEKVPVVIKEVSDESALMMALIENIQRENLNPIEEAQALERLAKEFSLTHIQVAEAVGKSRVTVTNLLRLLTLNDEVKLMLERGEIEMGHAKVLLALKGQEQSRLAKVVLSKGLSVRETERLVQGKARDIHAPSMHHRQTTNPDVRRLENSLSEKLGAAVEVVESTGGKGKLIIHFHSLEALDGILAHIH